MDAAAVRRWSESPSEWIRRIRRGSMRRSFRPPPHESFSAWLEGGWRISDVGWLSRNRSWIRHEGWLSRGWGMVVGRFEKLLRGGWVKTFSPDDVPCRCVQQKPAAYPSRRRAARFACRAAIRLPDEQREEPCAARSQEVERALCGVRICRGRFLLCKALAHRSARDELQTVQPITGAV